MTESVVAIQEINPQIVQVTMLDRIHKNTFSKELMSGLFEAFDTIAQDDGYKVVILTGYDSYFASGGTQEDLLSLHEGTLKFTSSNLYSLPMTCKIPVISAMQGHGIGGGFALGLFADFVILSRESVYTTNFMKYGFTPGMGATYIVPKKLGVSLAHEMLMNANTYRGEELYRRGAPFPVYPRNEVLPKAHELALQLSEKPRVSLITLKDHLVDPMRAELPMMIGQEQIMHEKTFHQEEVKNNITALFGR